MAVMSRMLPLVAYSTFAIFLLALMATPTNALAHEPHAHVARGHDSIAKRKRNIAKRAKRCRPQTTTLAGASATPSTSAVESTSVPAATSTPHAAASTHSTTSHSSSAAAATPTTTKPATTSSSSSAAAATTTSVSTGGGSSSGSTGLDPNKKLLLAWPNGPTDLEKYAYGTRVGGMYTWSPWCPENAATLNIPCFQQLWGFKQQSSFTSLINVKQSPLVFGFNEPNQGDQSNMSAQDGATLWNTVIRPLKAQGAKLVSPATTSAPSGKTWIQDMMKKCGDDCGFDFIALHWYGTNIDSFKAYVDDWYKTFGKPLIISEYACQDFSGGAQCSKSQTETFHYTMGAWFDQHPGVAMYAPFGFMHDMNNVNYDNQLMASNGEPNAMGKWYLYH